MRAKKSEGLVDTYYIGEHFEIQDGLEVKYIFGGNLRLAMVKENVGTFYHKDHLGSSTAMTVGAGVDVETTEYRPYGSVRSQTGSEVSGYNFTDQEHDPETGLYNYNARLYDPWTGQFITPDSIVPDFSDPQTLNRYSYCRGNPMVYVDPSGHSFFGIEFIIGAIIGAVTSGVQSDWDLGATLTGAFIGGISGGVFAEVSSAATSSLMGSVVGPNVTMAAMVENSALLGLAEVGGAMAGGAAAGATAGGLGAAFYGGDIGQGVLQGAGYGAIGGAAFGAIGSYYGETWNMSRVGLSAFAGGGVSELAGGNFADGFMLAGATSALYWGYQTMAGFEPNYGPGKDLPNGKYEPNPFKQAPAGYNVAGFNRKLTGHFWKDFLTQGGFVSKVINAFPGGNATAGLHDSWMNKISMNLVTNVATMLPATVVTYGGAFGGPMAPMSSAFMTSYKGDRND